MFSSVTLQLNETVLDLFQAYRLSYFELAYRDTPSPTQCFTFPSSGNSFCIWARR